VVRIATAYVSGRVHRVRASAELLAFLAVVYFLVSPALNFALNFARGGHLVEDVERAVISVLLLCFAFLLNGVVRAVFWEGLLSDKGQRKVPVIITEGVALSIYLSARHHNRGRRTFDLSPRDLACDAFRL
jgi:hypothetical protein